MEFIRAQIFGTTFEITSRYTDLQPVGMGAFGLVWYAFCLLTRLRACVGGTRLMLIYATPL